MIPSHIIEQNRERFREEGRRARLADVEIMDCPYTLAAQIDPMFGFKPASEWLKGWYEQDASLSQ